MTVSVGHAACALLLGKFRKSFIVNNSQRMSLWLIIDGKMSVRASHGTTVDTGKLEMTIQKFFSSQHITVRLPFKEMRKVIQL